jgi:gluconate kinase
MSSSPFLIVVSGLPASGKSTLARQLHEAMNLPLLDKDDILAPFNRQFNPTSLEQRRLLSSCADEALIQLAKQIHQGIVCSFWHHPGSSNTPGTKADWLKLIPGQVLEIYCHCTPETAIERFTIRHQREAMNEPKKSPPGAALSEYKIQAALGPLDITESLSVSTETPVNLQHLIPEIKAALQID